MTDKEVSPEKNLLEKAAFDNIEHLENIKQGYKRTISWNKYRSEITTRTKNNILDYLIDPTFRSTNRIFVLSFRNASKILREIFLISITCH